MGKHFINKHAEGVNIDWFLRRRNARPILGDLMDE